jgi:hypothetical protein
MKRLLLLVAVLMSVSSGAALAAGLLPGTPLSPPFPGVFTISEPGPDIQPPSPVTEVYGFGLPGPVAQGDVVLLEPGWTGLPDDPRGWSDVFAFGDVAPNVVHVYSDPSDQVTPLDLGRPLFNPVFLTEPPTVPETVFYQVPGVQYTLISDVPEPATLSLLALGGLLLARRRRG